MKGVCEMSEIRFQLHGKGGVTPLTVEYQHLFAIGYAGRNMEKTMEHIHELERDLGMPAPKRIPTIFECSNNLLTQEEQLQFIGKDTCGEAEYVIVLNDGKLYIGIGSDHTDRALESYNVLKSKQMCAKPIGTELWDYQDVKDHWDSIRISSFQTVDGEEIPYQSGTMAEILPPETIIAELQERVDDLGNSIIFSGTVPTLSGLKYGTTFRCEMIDDTLSRRISCFYRAHAITEEDR